MVENLRFATDIVIKMNTAAIFAVTFISKVLGAACTTTTDAGLAWEAPAGSDYWIWMNVDERGDPRVMINDAMSETNETGYFAIIGYCASHRIPCISGGIEEFEED